jgi:hypothetical protein
MTRKHSPQAKRGPARTLDHDAILDAHRAGRSCAAIARAAGTTPGSVSAIVSNARKRGDPRAIRRRAPNGQARTDEVVVGVWYAYWNDPAQLRLPLGDSRPDEPPP